MATEKVEKVTKEENHSTKDAKSSKKAAPKKVKEKKTDKVETPKKPMPTEARAIAYNVKVTPRKARLVLDVIRNKDVNVAKGILSNINRRASEPVLKVLKSAVANATNNFGMDEKDLYVASCYANDGTKMRRYLPRAKGSSSGLVKRFCHITVVVKMR